MGDRQICARCYCNGPDTPLDGDDDWYCDACGHLIDVEYRAEQEELRADNAEDRATAAERRCAELDAELREACSAARQLYGMISPLHDIPNVLRQWRRK